MSEPTVNITIRTTATGDGAQKVTAAVREATAATNPWITATKAAAAEQKKLNDELNRAAPQVSQAGDALDRGGKKAANFGQGMLQGSRAVQDFSAAGIPGMVNNVEGIAAALGLGASAAGGFTLAFVALEVVMRNWDTWFGPEKATQAKEFWSAMTPDEAQMTRLRESAELQDRIADSIKRIGEAKQKEMEQQEALADLWKGITPTAEERGDLPPLPGMAGPNAATAAAENKYATDAAVAIQADDAFIAQQKRVADMNRIASLDERIRLANAGDEQAIKGLNLGFNQAGQAQSPGDFAKLEAIQARMKARSDELRAQTQAVPGLTDGLTGDPEKDRATLQQRAAAERERLNQLDNERLRAAEQAAASGQDFRNAQQRETEGAAASAFRDLGLPPTPGAFAGSDERGGITAAVAANNAQLQQVQQQLAQALQQNGGAVVTSLGQLQTGMTGTLSAMVQKIAGIASGLAAAEAELQSIRSNTVR